MLDVHNSKTAFRRAKLIRRPLEGQPGSTFMFSINNRPIYAGGELSVDSIIWQTSQALSRAQVPIGYLPTRSFR